MIGTNNTLSNNILNENKSNFNNIKQDKKSIFRTDDGTRKTYDGNLNKEKNKWN